MLPLGACILGPDKPELGIPMPEAYKEASRKPDIAPPALDWWRGFRSPRLTHLIEAAYTDNLDIQAAAARILEADANARIAGAPLLPTVTADSSVTRSRSSQAGFNSASSSGGLGGGRSETSIYQASLSASYEIDFWGKNAAALRTSEQTAIANRFDREVIVLSTAASIATTYFQVVGTQERLRIARENLASAARILSLIKDRFTAGTASALDVAQQETLVATTRAAIPPLVQAARQNSYALAVLIGRPPEFVRIRGENISRIAIPRVTPGLPSDLLTQRPDIREAEANLASANANVENARAQFLPSIQLTGDGGYQSTALKLLFTPQAAFYSAAVSATQPIFDGFRLQGNLDFAKAKQDELLQTYRKSIISAFADVEKALVAVQQLANQERLTRDAVVSSRRAFELSEQRLRAGTIDLTTVLTTEQTLFQQQDALALVQLARLQAMVGLFQALGGGWTPEGGITLPRPRPVVLNSAVGMPDNVIESR